MRRFPGLRLKYVAALLAAYAAFGVAAGLTTFFALLADQSPNGLIGFLAGMVAGAICFRLIAWGYKRHIWERLWNAIPYPYSFSR